MIFMSTKLRELEARIAALETVPVASTSATGFMYVPTPDFLRSVSFKFCTWDGGRPGQVIIKEKP